MRADLHTHTTASDGELEPAALRALHAEVGFDLLAITDHDTVAGWATLDAAPPLAGGPRLIPGIEFSAADGRHEIHVVGLNIDPRSPAFMAAVDAQQARRRERAERIAARLQSIGVALTLADAQRHAGAAPPGRVHFARALVESGRVPDVESAFRRYLRHGKPGAVPHDWPDIEQVVDWVRAAGGRAVLAHPQAYDLGRKRLRELVGRFTRAGGEAIEVALANLRPDQMAQSAALAREFGLLASAGSDLHAPSQFWRLPSKVPQLPDDLVPVWHDWV